MVGKGTPTDPLRPQYAPWPPAPASARNGIISFSHEISDDGRFALVEFVAMDPNAFAPILNDRMWSGRTIMIKSSSVNRILSKK